MDLADAALGDTEHLADLAQGEVLDVEQDGDLALAAPKRGERAAEVLLGLRLGGLVQRIGRVVVAGEHVDALDARAVVGEHERVQRRHVGGDQVALAGDEFVGGHIQRVGQLAVGRRAAVDRAELGLHAAHITLPAAQRAGRPVAAAELVDDGAMDPRPGELLERRALLGVVAIERLDQRLEAGGDEVVDLAAGGQFADLAVHDELHERRVGQDEAIAQALITAGLVLVPELHRVLGLHPAAGGVRGLRLLWTGGAIAAGEGHGSVIAPGGRQREPAAGFPLAGGRVGQVWNRTG